MTPRRPNSRQGTPIYRLMRRVVYESGPMDTNCWIANFSLGAMQYARIEVKPGKLTAAHRFSYEYFVGPIPEGLVLDHLCRNRTCCNPDHLEPVTNRENILRGMSPAALAVRTNHCKYGHSLDDAYVSVQANGTPYRRCRPCKYLSKKAAR